MEVEVVQLLTSSSSSVASVRERNRLNAAAAEVNVDGEPRDLDSSAAFLLGGGDRRRDQQSQPPVDDCRWIANSGKNSNIYENIVNESVRQQLSFGGYGKLRKCEENIYENICEDCGRLYSAEKCAFCSVDEDENDEEDLERTKKTNKYSAKFQEFFGNFRIRPVKFGASGGNNSSTGSPFQNSKRKLCKSDIVHNVDGFEDVFRTNKSFDLGEICRMRDDARSERSHDRVVLHKSDDQLVSSQPTTGATTITTSAEEKPNSSVVPTPEKLKVRSASENLIDFSDRESETVYENLSPSSFVQRRRQQLVGKLGATSELPVNEWMMSLLVETEDYADDEVIYHVKSIPSVTFNDISSASGGNKCKTAETKKRDVGGSDLRYKVEEFRQNVLNNNRKWLELSGSKEASNESLDPAVITFRNSIFEADNADDGDSERGGTLTPCSPVVISSEDGTTDKSDFVCGLLNIFEAVLSREKEESLRNAPVDSNGHANDAISPYQSPQVNEPVDDDDDRNVCEQRLRLSQRKQPSKRRTLVQKHLLAVSLCRVPITYERRLKVFLLVASVGELVQQQQQQHRPNPKLVLNKRKTYLKAMTNEFRLRSGSSGSSSALRESVEIDKYFQFLEANESMINLTALKRRRRRRDHQSTTSSNELISCSSSTSGVQSDCNLSLDGGENIYQQIWTCKTDDSSSEPVYESPQDEEENIYESIRIEPTAAPRDEHEWEVVDDFAFSKKRLSQRRPPPPVPHRNIRHPLDRYRNVCILYSLAEPKANRIVYNYRRDYVFDYRRKCDDDDEMVDSGASSSSSSSTSGAEEEEDEEDFCTSCAESEDEDSNDVNKDHKPPLPSRGVPTSKHSCYSIPDCVQYWKFMLLHVNYNDDEEDMIMTDKTFALIANNIDSNAPPVDHQSSSLKSIRQAPLPPLPHSPTFTGPTIKIKPELPISDSCPGKYTSKSSENLTDVVPSQQHQHQQEQEKSPTPKRERLRDKMKAVLPLSSSRNSDDGLVFGVELDQVERDEKGQIPRFVAECVEILQQPEFIETGGLYRASGNKNSIENIKKKLNEKRSSKKYEFLKKQDVHSLTGSLKLFFRELRSPLIPRDVYELCVQKTKDEAQTIENIKLGLKKMELINRNTLRYIVQHLKCVHQNSDVNMMNSSNLAIVWGACLFASTLGLMESYENNDLGRINTLVKQLIDHCDRIFYSDSV